MLIQMFVHSWTVQVKIQVNVQVNVQVTFKLCASLRSGLCSRLCSYIRLQEYTPYRQERVSIYLALRLLYLKLNYTSS